MTITNEQWELYTAKYGKLMHMISQRISGDAAIASPEDNYRDLCIAALNSIKAYEKKTGQKFDQAFGTELFDKYTKTVLWKAKAKKGVPLSKKMAFRNKHVSLSTSSLEEGEEFYDIEDTKSEFEYSNSLVVNSFSTESDEVKRVVDAILNNPDVLSGEGLVKAQALARELNISLHYISKAINRIKTILKDKSNGL